MAAAIVSRSRILLGSPATRPLFRFASSMTTEAFKKHEVVPDVIPTAPENLVKVSYKSGVEATLGNVLTPRQVKDPPTVSWDAEQGALYTLVKTDPDAPSRKDPKFREWHHWLVVNVPGNDVSKGDTLSEYIGAGPPEGTGLHRYVYLVYKQPGKVSDAEHGHLTNRSGDKRNNFKIASFAQKHNLGNPVAGNFFQEPTDSPSVSMTATADSMTGEPTPSGSATRSSGLRVWPLFLDTRVLILVSHK